MSVLASEASTLVDELVVANHILYDRGVVDGYGHISARVPDRSDTFHISRSLAPALVTADDIQTLDFSGNDVNGDPRPTYLERFIHAEIYRARPDVMAVVHSHSPSVIPFSVSQGTRLRAVCQMCGFLEGEAPVYEIRDDAGDGSDLLIRNPKLGAALVRKMEQHAAILMRGHGATIVGKSVRQAVFRSVYIELNARLQSSALHLGPVTYLTPAEAAAVSAVADGQLDRTWLLWAQEVAERTGRPTVAIC